MVSFTVLAGIGLLCLVTVVIVAVVLANRNDK